MPLDQEVSVGAYQRLAHAGDRRDRRGRPHRRSSSAAPASTSARRSRDLELPPPPAAGRPRALGARLRRASAPRPRTRLLAERDPAAAARVHPNDRRRVVRALELAEVGASLAPADDRLWSRGRRATRRSSSRSTSPLEELDRADRGARRGDGRARAPSTRRRRAWAAPLSQTARKVLGLEEFATLPLERGGRRGRRARRGASRATSASGCAGCRSWLPSTPAGHPRRSPMRSSRWHAQGNVYLVAEEPLTAERRARAGRRRRRHPRGARSAATTGSRSRSGTPTARGPRCRATARGSPRAGSPSGRAPSDVTVRVGAARGAGAHARPTGSSSRSSGRSSSASPEEVDGIRFTPVDVGNPHAVVDGDPAELPRSGRCSRRTRASRTRTNVQVARAYRRRRRSRRACGSGGWARPARRARARSPSPRLWAAARPTSASRAATSTSGSTTAGRTSQEMRSP